jgi:hypothetical protein
MIWCSAAYSGHPQLSCIYSHYWDFFCGGKHSQTLNGQTEYFNTQMVQNHSLLHSEGLCYYCSLWQSLVATVSNGNIWRNWTNPHPIVTSTWTSSIFHIPCSTRWTNSSSEPHIVFAYYCVWTGRKLTLAESNHSSQLLKRYQEKCSWNITTKDKKS